MEACPWSTDDLKNVLGELSAGSLNCYQAHLKYKSPYATLNDWWNGKRTSHKHGKTVLSTAEEELLANWIITMQDVSRSLSYHLVRDKVQTIVENKSNPFRKRRPGKSWKKRFFHRWYDLLGERTVQAMEAIRSRAVNKARCEQFYKNLQATQEKHGPFPPERIWNADESGFHTGRNGSKRVIARKGSRVVNTPQADNRMSMTYLGCVNAAGYRISGLYLFKGIRQNTKVNYLKYVKEPGQVAMSRQMLT